MTNPYESDQLLAEYLLFHYGADDEILGKLPGPREALSFPRRSVSELIGPMQRDARALDVGCAVGRATFELARYAASVTGIDFSARFIAAAQELKTNGSCESSRRIEGDLALPFTAKVAAGIENSRVTFETGDAMNLRPDLAGFDAVLAANLICRLPEPRKFLDRLPQLVKPGGQLLLTTPFTWLEEFTPRGNWLASDGKRSFDVLKEILTPHFELQVTKDLPFLIREHERKFQYGIALGTRWLRRSSA
ncbi:MAG: putative 4-mercaptohistidine N1-methyltransferase [Terrimicrobiaceae bacterium]